MKNRVLTVLFVLALLIGALGMGAAAVDANTVATPATCQPLPSIRKR